MSEQVVEVVHGKHHKYEIVKKTSPIDSIKYYVYRDGSYFKGSYSSLSDAVAAARSAG